MENIKNQALEFKNLPEKEQTKVKFTYVSTGVVIGLTIGLLFSIWQIHYLSSSE